MIGSPHTITRLVDPAYAPILYKIDSGDSSNWSVDSYQSGLAVDEFYGIFSGSELAGFISVQVTPEFAEITNFCIEKSFRRLGYGGRLLQFLLQQYKNRNILLEVRESNLAANALYLAAGFVVYAVRKKYYGGSEDALLMRKKAEILS